MTDAESLARLFHETYERLAPQYGYETREDTKEFDAESPNGKLMIAVCGEVAARLAQPTPESVVGGDDIHPGHGNLADMDDYYGEG